MVDKELAARVLEARCKSCHIMSIKLVTGAEVLNVICVYVAQVRLANNIKKVFWEKFEEVSRVCLKMRNSLWGEILMGMLDIRQMRMI